MRAAAVAAEAVTLIALIWVTFQGYAAWAWSACGMRSEPGSGWYTIFELLGFVRPASSPSARTDISGSPMPRPYVAAHWRFGQLYKNPEDPALFVPTRDGSHWTLNFGRPKAATLLGLILLIGIVGPTVILMLALRS